MNRLKKCQITSVGKRRDGGTRYWCLEHKADATAKYGRRAQRCRYAHIPPIAPNELLKLNPARYGGGVALWGAVPPVYDTTRWPIDRGIHVHARKTAGRKKEIDRTYRSVILIDKHTPRDGLIVSELDAIYYMVTSLFGYPMKYVECTLCGFPHLDKDWFSLHSHRRHLCAGCGKQFRDVESGIGNPLVKIREVFTSEPQKIKSARRSLWIRQNKYPGGIQIWGSNPAFLWTASRKEEEGIHVHAASADGKKVLVDNTFSEVAIDGINLEPKMVRVLMAQTALPHISGRIVDVRCPHCGVPHFDTGDLAFTPHELHVCASCGFEFRSGGRLRKTIGNPVVGILARLASTAPRAPQQHQTNLLPETL